MAKTIKLTVEKRQLTGRKLKKLRLEGILPANVYGKGVESQSIQLPLKEFKTTYDKAGETGIIELEIGKKIHPALIANVSYDPVTGLMLHVDFKEINLKEKVSATVPVVLVGEAPAEKSGEGTVIQHVNDIQVKALPADLPDEFKVDVSIFEKADQAILASDLEYDREKIELEIESDQLIAKVEAPKEEKEPEPIADEAEGEANQETSTTEPEQQKTSEESTSE